MHDPKRPAHHPDDTPGVVTWPIRRVTSQGEQALEVGVVVEEPLEIRLDGQAVAVLMRTPGLDKELAAGFVLGEGLVADLMDIALIRHCGQTDPELAAEHADDPLDESRNRVDVTLMPGVVSTRQQPGVVQLIRSGCGRTEVAAWAENHEPVQSPVRIAVEALPPMMGQITRMQAGYRAAGGIHAAAIFDLHGRCLIVCEDIGRHNAVDKAAGYCLLRGIPLRDKVLVSTGRASYDMVAKGARLGLPVLVSISSPTSLAVELADALNCTLIGYLRGKTLNIYTHHWRILPAEDPNH